MHSALRRLIAACALLLAAAAAPAQGIESVLRPGELIRGHAKWDDDCAQCHVRFDRAAQNERCMACHQDVGADVRQHTGFHGRQRPQPCRGCHTDHKGRDARIVLLDEKRFDHAQTDYALRGRHREVACSQCHPAGRKHRQAPADCASCHRRDDVHKGSLGNACADCHGEAGWKPARFDHDRTRFALAGRHADAKCADCHRGGALRETPRECIGCHRKDDDGARGHRGRYGPKCESCHGTQAWKPHRFNHEAETRFALRGKHRSAECGACHTGALYRDKLGSACIDCHRRDDKHQGALGRDCQACHGERDWKETGGRFDHDRTRFALLGRHRDVRCADCHRDTRYRDTPSTCIACHRQDDRHRPSLGEDCAACHAERGWKDVARLDHDKTRFVLRGRHRDTKCAACHRSADYRATPTDCAACHRTDDRHAGTLGPRCADCHGEAAWKPAPAFDHQRTRFALRGAHAAPRIACRDCHADAKHYRDTPRDCIACHRRDDSHAGQLGERCEACHADTRWLDVRFDHARARFALLGRHLAVECGACHKSKRYREAPRDCDGCHRADDRHQLRLGSACDSCHNARSWRLWSFDHARRTRFALDGAHLKLACERCHAAPAPRGQPIAPIGGGCLACHQRDDRHDGAFGAQCERCHDTGDWKRIRHRGSETPAPRAPS
ncbi:cytochrome c3 family protein [Aquabacterium humicola]|uniref:cytochrome c3 family protein n=1 Tax=Aquabacterium humicola TaxID=3237377 RepID=UPI0025426E71|nr:cytochrome c3 family protein [Rubrivivax pictus]